MIFRDQNTADYAISKDTQASKMKEVTMCFWVKSKQVTGCGHYISYAVSNADNRILLRLQTDLRLAVQHHGSSLKETSSR